MSGTWQKSMPASDDLNGDDPNGFIDIDELLSGVQQKGRTSVDPDYGGMAVDMIDNRTRGGSPSSSSRSTAGSSRGEHLRLPVRPGLSRKAALFTRTPSTSYTGHRVSKAGCLHQHLLYHKA